MGKCPKIRFSGYTDDWEQRKLSEVAEIVGGGTPSTNIPEYWDGDIDWYAPAEINDQIYVDGSERKITKLGLEKSSAKILPADKTVLFTSRAGIGKTAILRRSGSTNQGFQSMVLNDETNPYFVFSISKFIKEEAERVASGSTFAEVSGKMLGNLAFMFPTKKEQDKIGEYFSNLDHLITLHQRKCDELTRSKKAMLQKMFPQKGKKKPEIRFAGFTDDWEQRKFSEIAQRQSETMVSDDDNPCVEYEDVISEQGVLNKDIYAKGVYKNGIRFTSEDVLYGKLRPYLHNWLNPDFAGVAVGDWWVLRPINANKNFLYRLIQTSQYDDAANQSSGTKMPRADWKLISNMVFQIPASIDEQAKIAGVIDNLDNLITHHQCKLEKLKMFKKSMLEKMFV